MKKQITPTQSALPPHDTWCTYGTDHMNGECGKPATHVGISTSGFYRGRCEKHAHGNSGDNADVVKFYRYCTLNTATERLRVWREQMWAEREAYMNGGK